MAIFKEVKSIEKIMGKLSHGGDLLEEMTDICRKKSIRLGRVEAMGAVQKARLAYYNQQTHEYQFFSINQPLEITKLIGNISLKGGIPWFMHISLWPTNQERPSGGILHRGRWFSHVNLYWKSLRVRF